MDLKIIYVIFYVLLFKSVEPSCETTFNEYECFYQLTCVEDVRIDFSWMAFAHRPDRMHYVDFYDDEDLSCEKPVMYVHYRLYPIHLKIRQQNMTSEVPNSARFDLLDVIYELDMSGNEFSHMPVIKSMHSLVRLKMLRNYLPTAILSNKYELLNLTEIDLSFNNIINVQVNKSQYLYKELKVINLSHNLIINITDGTFIEFKKLQALDISNNHIEILSPNIFDKSLKSLNTIYLSNNKIKSLPKELFSNSIVFNFTINENALEGPLEKGMLLGVNETILDFSYQHITEIKDYAFYNLKWLNILFLNFNHIKSLSNESFKTLMNLQQLDLSNNQITNIDFNKEDLGNLQSLLLKNNCLTEIKHDQLQHLIRLEYLDLSDNKIFRLEPESFKPLRTLINVELCNNPLVGNLRTGTFDGLVSIPYLHISYNKLSSVKNATFKDMIKLRELNMSNCEITEIQYNAFINTGHIEMLDLSYNKLTKFFVNATELSSLRLLFLNNNEIKTLPMLNGLAQLYELNLSENNIENIQGSLNNSVNLYKLDLSYNKNINFHIPILTGNNRNLNTLILSGIKTPISFVRIIKDGPISNLGVSYLKILNANVKNISNMYLNALVKLDILDLSHNNISELRIGDFSNVTKLKFLDLSFNHIYYIQPGVFKDNYNLFALNISHNCILSIHYGILRGLMQLRILDMSFNKINDLHRERFYEAEHLSQLILDANNINSINVNDFLGTSLTKLSIGDNPLPCRLLANIIRTGYEIEITAMRLDEINHENVKGITCNKERMFDKNVVIRPPENANNNSKLNDQNNILNKLSNTYTTEKFNDTPFLGHFIHILETSNSMYNEKLSELANLTSKIVELSNNNYNAMNNRTLMYKTNYNLLLSKLDKIITLFENKITPKTAAVNNSLVNDKDTDTLSKVKHDRDLQELQDAISFDKKGNKRSNIVTNYHQSESLKKVLDHENNSLRNINNSRIIMIESCVILILLTLIGLVCYKLFKAKMMKRRLRLSNRELPDDIENSTL